MKQPEVDQAVRFAENLARMVAAYYHESVRMGLDRNESMELAMALQEVLCIQAKNGGGGDDDVRI